jgi:HK97 family phage major capsid protein
VNTYSAERDRLLAEKSALLMESRAILDRAQLAARDLTEDEDRTATEIAGKLEALNRQVDALGRLADSAALGESVRSSLGDAVGRSGQTTDRDPIRTLIRSGEPFAEYTFPDHDELRALATDSAIVPVDFANRVAVYERTYSPWIGLATIVPGGSPLTHPMLTADPTTYTPGEGTAITESTPVINDILITTTSYKTLSYVSNEAMEDEAVDLTNLIARSAARSIGLSFGSAATTAILAGITNGGTASGTPFFDMDDLITLQYSAAAPYREAGVWVMANGAISKTRKFKDSEGQYLWQSSNISGQPGGLLGGAPYEDPSLATPASATKSVIYGDPAAGLVIRASAIRVEVSRDARFATDETAIKVVHRLGLGIVDPLALRYLVSANT